MVKKGLSLEQKRDVVLGVFNEEDDVFQLKDIEKKAAARGVVSQSVKDVVKSLVDDELVHQDKIGIGNFLWSFAAEASTKVTNDENKLMSELKSAKADAASTQAQLEEWQGRETDASTKAELQAQLEQLQARHAELSCRKAALEVVDPKRHAGVLEGTEQAKDAANRWLDNVYNLEAWAKKQFAGRERDLAAFFKECGMSENLDYIK